MSLLRDIIHGVRLVRRIREGEVVLLDKHEAACKDYYLREAHWQIDLAEDTLGRVLAGGDACPACGMHGHCPREGVKGCTGCPEWYSRGPNREERRKLQCPWEREDD